LLTAAGALLALRWNLRGLGVSLYLAGVGAIVFSIVAGRQVSGYLLGALALRASADAQDCLRRTQRIWASLLLYFLAAFVGCIPYYLLLERPRRQLSEYQSRFEPHLDEYLALVSSEGLAVDVSVTPYVKGKAVVVELSDAGPRISEVHRALPAEVRAETPDEAGTLVFIEWREALAGPYGSTLAKGYRINADVRIIDLPEKTLLGLLEFQGGDPPRAQPREGDGYGPKPIDKIAGYVAGVERK
jgi:hypothetical protein